MIKPIRPSEVDKTTVIPEAVIEAFNELITKNYLNGFSKVEVSEVCRLISEKMAINQSQVNSLWLNVEDIYRKAGWLVVYDAPGYNENYVAFFTFTTKKR
jgi:hypothetical protein